MLPPELWVQVQNHLSVPQSLQLFLLTRCDSNLSRTVVSLAMQRAVSQGDLPALQQLLQRFHHVYPRPGVRLLRSLCYYSNLPILQWLHQKYGIPRQQLLQVPRKEHLKAYTLNFSALKSALCSGNGSVPLVQWLVDTFQLTREELIVPEKYHLRAAIYNNSLSVVQWLHYNYTLTLDELQSEGALHVSIEAAKSTALWWLLTSFPFTKEHVLALTGNPFLFGAFVPSRRHWFHVLVKHFGFEKQELMPLVRKHAKLGPGIQKILESAWD